MKELLFKPKAFLRWRPFFLFQMILLLPLLMSCTDEENFDRKEYVVFSETTDKKPISSDSVIYCNVEGGTKTFYIFSNVEYDYFIRTKDKNEEWVKIIGADYLEDIGATRIVLEISPIDTYEKRTATLTISSGEYYLGRYVVFSQGFKNLFTDGFEWLGYGTSSPFETSKETLIAAWTQNQKAKGWTSSIAEGKEAAYCYGKNGYLKLGTENVGADLLTPYFSGLTGEKVLLYSFNAVAYTSGTGVQDANKLTLKIEGGGDFSTGGTTKTIDLGYYNYEDPDLSSSMWNNSAYQCYVVSTNGNPITANTRLRFITGESVLEPANRVFIDNVSMYSIDENSYYLAGYDLLNKE